MAPALGILLAVGAGCGGTSSATTASQAPSCGHIVRVVAAENVWGNVAAQIGGRCAVVRSIIKDASTDPHLYQPSSRDAGAVAQAQVIIQNGAGYDAFMSKLLGVSAHRPGGLVVVEHTLSARGTDPNPHFWYDVAGAPKIAGVIEAALIAADPAAQPVFDSNLQRFISDLEAVNAVIRQIRTRYLNVPAAYTERVPAYLLAQAGLRVNTPPGFARAIEDGNEPSPSDVQAMNELVTGHRIKVLLYNSQATSRATAAISDLAHGAGIPVVGVTETLPVKELTYQSWQLHQAQALLAALGG